MANTRVLVVEDEEALATLLEYNLRRENFDVALAADGEEALMKIEEFQPDIVILDWMLPRVSGIEVCRQIRSKAETKNLPIIMLTARSEEADRIRGLETGADDYLTKPFSTNELIARVRAVLRRANARETGAKAAGTQSASLERGQLVMDQERHTCTWKGEPVTLTVTEFLILHSLAQRPGVVKSRDALMDSAYDEQVYVDDRTIDSHIKRLRKKFKLVDDDFDVIETLYGVGYRFKEA